MPSVTNLTPGEDVPQGVASGPDWKFVALSATGLVFGFVLGFYLVSLSPGAAPENESFVESAEFEIWRVLLASNLSIWIGSIPLQTRWFKQAHKTAGSGRRGFWIAFTEFVIVILVIVMVLWMARGDAGPPLEHATLRLVIVQTVGIVVSGFSVMGLLIVGNAARTHPVSWESPDTTNANRILHFRKFNRRFLALLGGFIGLSVLATGALRDAEVAAGIMFPSENVVLYGAFFTALVAALYVPAYAAVESLAMRMLDKAFPIPTIGLSDYSPGNAVDQMQGREVYSNTLKVGGTAKGNLEGVLLVFTPLLTALFASALGA